MGPQNTGRQRGALLARLPHRRRHSVRHPTRHQENGPAPAQANQRIVATRGQGGPNFIDNAILGPLRAKRAATLDRIAIAIGRQGTRPTGLDALAPCALNTAGNNNGGAEEELPGVQGPNLEIAGNVGGIVRPTAVLIEYRGNPTNKVVPMPRFLRAITGDAKPTSRGPAKARPVRPLLRPSPDATACAGRKRRVRRRAGFGLPGRRPAVERRSGIRR